jgi:hypothetical protein
MKKIILLSFFVLISALSAQPAGKVSEHKKPYFSAFSAGYVFKNDDEFKDVYGHGMINAITADGCYYPWKHWGLGIKVSYWRAKGKTTFLKQHALAQEVPITFYVRAIKGFQCGFDFYGSLGGGIAWMKEKSYLGDVHVNKGVGEAEVGFNYSLWRCVNVTGAFRYLFPPQSESGERMDVGGCDLRAGIGFKF